MAKVEPMTTEEIEALAARNAVPSFQHPRLQPDGPEPTLTITMSRKVNLGQYEMAEVFVAVSGVRAGMTETDLAPLLGTGKLAWSMAADVLRDQLGVIRRTRGWESKDAESEEQRAAYEREQRPADTSGYEAV